jgi:hypothetical protein
MEGKIQIREVISGGEWADWWAGTAIVTQYGGDEAGAMQLTPVRQGSHDLGRS